MESLVYIDEIKSICERTRNAAYRVYLHGKLPVHTGIPFPCGTCGWVSVALGAILATEYPQLLFFYVSGICGNQTHAWIEYQNYIIDITADQFDEIDKSILIIVKEESDFHKKYQVVNSVRVNEEFMRVYLNYNEESRIFKEYYAMRDEVIAE